MTPGTQLCDVQAARANTSERKRRKGKRRALLDALDQVQPLCLLPGHCHSCCKPFRCYQPWCNLRLLSSSGGWLKSHSAPPHVQGLVSALTAPCCWQVETLDQTGTTQSTPGSSLAADATPAADPATRPAGTSAQQPAAQPASQQAAATLPAEALQPAAPATQPASQQRAQVAVHQPAQQPAAPATQPASQQAPAQQLPPSATQPASQPAAEPAPQAAAQQPAGPAAQAASQPARDPPLPASVLPAGDPSPIASAASVLLWLAAKTAACQLRWLQSVTR